MGTAPPDPPENTTGVTDVDPASRAAAEPGGAVVVSWEDADGSHRHALRTRELVGQSGGSGICVADPHVSRLHCELDPRGDGVWVRDLGSTNGTWLGQARIERVRIGHGASLRVGHTKLLFHVERSEPKADRWHEPRFGELLGPSARMREVFAGMARVAVSNSTVLLEGETGTGKELAARALHDASARGYGPYVVVDCGALPDQLLEAELFGHVRGAFTGATHTRDGALMDANGGTVFLDEVGELPLALQPRLLRFLDARTVRRVGETRPRKVDVRVIAATHRDLPAMVNEGTFREDLYFRLAVVPLRLPPLRERREDIPALVRAFVGDRADELIQPGLLDDLCARSWPGNVRELRNHIDRLAALGPVFARRLDQPRRHSDPSAAFPPVRTDEPLAAQRERWLGHLEREFLAAALREHGGNVTAVARAAGLHRSHVYRLMMKHGM